MLAGAQTGWPTGMSKETGFPADTKKSGWLASAARESGWQVALAVRADNLPAIALFSATTCLPSPLPSALATRPLSPLPGVSIASVATCPLLPLLASPGDDPSFV